MSFGFFWQQLTVKKSDKLAKIVKDWMPFLLSKVKVEISPNPEALCANT